MFWTCTCMHHILNLLWFRFRWRVLTWYPTKPIFWWLKKGNLLVNSKPQLHNSNLKKRNDTGLEKKERNTREKITWENSRHFATPLLVSPRNDVWETSEEIPTDDVWDSASYWLKFASTNQKLCPDLGSDASPSVWISQKSFRGETSGGVGCFLRLGKKQTTEEEPYCVLPLNRVFIYFYLFAYSNFCCSSGYVSLAGGPLMTRPLHAILTA